MPREVDKRIAQGRANRNKKIQADFAKRWNAGLRWDIIMDELILKYGLSESTIYQIVKENGSYSK